MRWVGTRLVVLCLGALLLASCTTGVPIHHDPSDTNTYPTDGDSVTVVCAWKPGETGSPATLYQLELSTGQVIETTRTKIRVRVPAVRLRAHVRGCNDEGCGPYSHWSPWFPARVDTLDMDNPPNDGRR